MADPAASGRRYYQGGSGKAPAIPPHHSHLSRAAALQDEPQHTALGRTGIYYRDTNRA